MAPSWHAARRNARTALRRQFVQDKIGLSAIDANNQAGGNQAFTWLGQGNFHYHHPGELIYRLYNFTGTAHDKTIIYGDINGDAKADFQIELTGLKALVASDFIL